MAIGVGQIILSSDMRSWYTRLNAIISRYGGGMAQMGVPAAGKTAQASDVNTVVYKLNQMKNDAYLGYDKGLYTAYGTVAVGSYISATTGTQLNNVITNLERIRCRNDATKMNGNTNNRNQHTWSQGAHWNAWSQSHHFNVWSQGTHFNVWSQGAHWNGWSHGTHWNGWSNWSHGNGWSNWAHGNGNSRSYCSNGLKTHGGNYNGNQCAYWSNSGTNYNGSASSLNYNGAYSSANYNGCSQSANYNAWNQAVNYNGWSQAVNYNGWSQGAHWNQWGQAINYNGWTNWVNQWGTRKDIYHARRYV